MKPRHTGARHTRPVPRVDALAVLGSTRGGAAAAGWSARAAAARRPSALRLVSALRRARCIASTSTMNWRSASRAAHEVAAAGGGTAALRLSAAARSAGRPRVGGGAAAVALARLPFAVLFASSWSRNWPRPAPESE